MPTRILAATGLLLLFSMDVAVADRWVDPPARTREAMAMPQLSDDEPVADDEDSLVSARDPSPAGVPGPVSVSRAYVDPPARTAR